MLINLSILILLLMIYDNKDKVSLIIITYYMACILAQAMAYTVDIDSASWSFINMLFNLPVITACLICYHQSKDRYCAFYAALVTVAYVIPDMIQFYLYEISSYEHITTMICLIEIVIVGRGNVKRNLRCYTGWYKRFCFIGSNYHWNS